MHEYEILYQRWKKYRRKKIATRFIIPFILLAGAAGGYYYFKQIKSTPSSKPMTVSQNNENIILPNKNFENQLHTYKEKKRSVKKKAHKKSQKNLTVKKSPKKVLISSQASSLSDLEAAFNTHPTVQKAIIIAQRYYEKGEFKSAAKWAYKANTLDKTNEESWLLFAKALAKDGKKKKAVKILRIYYKKSKSPKAKLLLEKIIEGDF